ncbi:MAG: DnaD domain protein [Ruminococcaceae bacterium]|nr:DnaD domain protein [Oscillospiraceae bacterium]
MKIKPVIEGPCVIVPASPVIPRLSEAGGTRLKVLLYILSDPEFDSESAAEALNITLKSFNAAIEYWMRAGAIECEGFEKKAKQKKESALLSDGADGTNVTVKRPRPVARASELPRYSTEQIAAYVEEHNIGDLLSACQQYMGKMFTTAEVETVVGLLDYLKLEPEYIMLLFAHCEKMNKKSLRYVEKLAIGLFDKDILGYEELDSHLNAIEAAAQMDKPLRDLFGIGRRALTKKEKEAFETWVGKWALPMALIERAYEVTVENTGNASVPYCNAVLQRWYESGYKSIEEVEAAMAEYKHDKDGSKDKKGSFDEDDFFEAALRRSYGQGFDS